MEINACKAMQKNMDGIIHFWNLYAYNVFKSIFYAIQLQSTKNIYIIKQSHIQ